MNSNDVDDDCSKCWSAELIYDASWFSDAHDKPTVLVPIVGATPETLAGYGKMVPDYESEHVTRVTCSDS